MIEIFWVVLASSGLAGLARRRGGRAWPWVVLLVVGYLIVTKTAALLIGAGPHLLVGLLWIGLIFGAVLVFVGRGRRQKSTWQCPECQFFNEPTTLVCPCGYRLEA